MERVNRERVSQLIKEIRRSKNLSQYDMADLLGVSDRTISRWENGASLPSMDDVVQICNQFNISLEEVFEGERNIEKELSRRMETVNTSIKGMNDSIFSTAETVKKMDSKMNTINESIKNASLLNPERDNDENNWLVLVVVHRVTSLLCFLYFGINVINRITIICITLVYMLGFTFLIIKNRHNRSYLKIVIYCLLAALNYFICFYTGDIAIKKDYEFSVETILINGPLLGLNVIGRYDMKIGLILIMMTYFRWIILCFYFLSSNKNKFIRVITYALTISIILIFTISFVAKNNPDNVFMYLIPMFFCETHLITVMFIARIAHTVLYFFKEKSNVYKKIICIFITRCMCYFCCTVDGATRMVYVLWHHPTEAFQYPIIVESSHSNIIYSKSTRPFTYDDSLNKVPMRDAVKCVRIGLVVFARYTWKQNG
ncbi:MAG: helix-turn-helix domain-containing protein [Erysipelotrichaceae bacterium]|nr:helix-turn-helix domain-containing protein [Erysipelotrichaceae bacterium]